jgi:hypothetical protein
MWVPPREYPVPTNAASDTLHKALELNLDSNRYGTFAEIGAGQEVVRWFFRAGGAAGTIAKSISAYDMEVSDAIYGKAGRYVSRERLESMLEFEHRLNLERLDSVSGHEKTFFAFADTVAARSYRGGSECHGWMGIRFQARPRAQDSQILLHTRMLDPENLQQQEALGILGVNLIHGAFNHFEDPQALLRSLLDGLSARRIEIDMIELSGECFANVDGRIMSLELVRLGLTPAAMFASSGETLQVSEALYRKPALVLRGRFRPPTLVHQNLHKQALAAFSSELEVEETAVISILEMTLQDLSEDGEIDVQDFVDRVDLLGAADYTVLISSYTEYYRLASYLGRNTSERIGLALGLDALRKIFDESYYDDLEGGLAEAIGRLFKRNVKLYVHPRLDPESGALATADDIEFPGALDGLYRYIAGQGFIQALQGFERSELQIDADDVLARIRSGDATWETMVPARVAELIRKKRLFGYV